MMQGFQHTTYSAEPWALTKQAQTNTCDLKDQDGKIKHPQRHHIQG